MFQKLEAFAFVLFGLAIVASSVGSTPLDDYVNTPDPHYKYELIQSYQMPGYSIHVLNLTSQKWLDETIVVNPIWWHYLTICIPDVITRPDAAFVLIDGGSNTVP
jgi:PhoPQ-activated pathogenicity-related protein